MYEFKTTVEASSSGGVGCAEMASVGRVCWSWIGYGMDYGQLEHDEG